MTKECPMPNVQATRPPPASAASVEFWAVGLGHSLGIGHWALGISDKGFSLVLNSTAVVGTLPPLNRYTPSRNRLALAVVDGTIASTTSGSPMMKFHSLFVLVVPFFLAWPAAAQADVIISEFMPANDRTLADEDGAFPDWIELFNAGSGPVNLLGWHLTDNPGAPGQWTFPSVTVAPGGFLVVFASGKNRTNDPTHLHTSFQLDADGGYLALVKPDGAAIASAFTYPAVKEDVSFGI